MLLTLTEFFYGWLAVVLACTSLLLMAFGFFSVEKFFVNRKFYTFQAERQRQTALLVARNRAATRLP